MLSPRLLKRTFFKFGRTLLRIARKPLAAWNNHSTTLAHFSLKTLGEGISAPTSQPAQFDSGH